MSSTPEGFDGIFYDPETGSDDIFDMGPFYPEYLKEIRDDALFLSMGAYIDVLLNGYPELAQSILDTSRKIWPDVNWEEKSRALERCISLAESKVPSWRNRIFAIVREKFLPSSWLVPKDFEAHFFDQLFYKALFSLRAALVKTLSDTGKDPGMAIFAWIDCFLNNEEELANELEDAIRHFYPDQDWKKLREVAAFAQEEKEKENPELEEVVFQKLVDVYKPKTIEAKTLTINGKTPLVA